jgi:radical SAM protein with 4Fe4S-binding SPASM domain
MHKGLAEMIAAARRHNPGAFIMVTSNGGGWQKDAYARIAALFKAGLNTLALDDYKHSGGWVTNIKAQLAPYEDVASWRVHHYPSDPKGNPHHRHKEQKLVYLNDIEDNSTGNHQLTNQGGASFAAKKEPLAQRCAKPFRELSVRWDGNVAICCDDWKGTYKVGNVNDMPLQDIWYHPRFEAARRKLYAADRNMGASAPCTGCDVRTYRNGLLPDKLGKGAMLPPDDESNAVVREALRGRVFSIMLGKGD